jgi:cytochrome c
MRGQANTADLLAKKRKSLPGAFKAHDTRSSLRGDRFTHGERQMRIVLSASIAAIVLAAGFAFPSTTFAADAEAAKALARQNNCFKCHGTDKDKDGPSLKKIAGKYKGEAGAADKLVNHLTSGEKVKFPDGHEEAHKIVEPKDPAGIKNLVDWILSM